MERITSRQNKIVRDAAALLGSPEERRRRKGFLCEGARLCEDAARSGVEVLRCFVTQQAMEKYARYVEPVLAVSRESYLVADHVAGLLSDTRHPQGVFCQCRWPQGLGESPDSEDCSLAVLEDLQDPGNLGTILRTAEALGVERVILLGDCCDPLSPKALRASMGAVFRLRIGLEADSQVLCSRLEQGGYGLLASVPDSGALPVTAVNFAGQKCAVFIGNEGNGLRADTIARCRPVTIPMAGRAESLNASAAATILLWEMARGRGKAHG